MVHFLRALKFSTYPSIRLFPIKYQGETAHWYYGQMINDWLAIAEEEGGKEEGERDENSAPASDWLCGWEKGSIGK